VRHRTTVRTGRFLAATLALGLCVPAQAHEEGEAEDEEEVGSRISGVMQIDFTNVYFFRGILNERDGFIAQPWAELYLNAFASDDGPIRDVTVGFGVWNSFHSEKTLATSSPSTLYETDWYPLLSVGLPYGLTWTTTYYFYTSPNGAFSTVEELNLKLAWDDSEVLGRWALAPWVNFAIETDRTSFGDREGVGVQLGVAPTLYELEDERFPVSFAFPVELGLTIDDYYEEAGRSEDTFGYLSWGLVASLPLSFVPKSFGEWAVSLAGKGFYFSDALERANKGDELYPVVTASLGFSF
jgi:hypothetical protein